MAKIQFDCYVKLKDFLQDQHQTLKRRKLNDKMFFCGVCTKYFNFPSKLKRHFVVHNKLGTASSFDEQNEDQQAVCNEDNEDGIKTLLTTLEQSTEQNLIEDDTMLVPVRRKVKKTKEKFHFCDVCQKGFRRPNLLRKHLPCPFAKLETASNFAVHKEEQLAVQNEDVVKKLLSTLEQSTEQIEEDTISVPVRRKPEEKRHFCDVCHKGFWRPYLLRKHLPCPLAKNKNQFSCKVCKRTFTQAKLLKKHSRLHSNKQNHVKPRPKLRIKLNSRRKAHECHVCHKKFLFNYLLVRHNCQAVEKPFYCHLCQRTFGTMRSLKEHKSCLPVPSESYSCVCGLSFPNKSQLTQHSLVHQDTLSLPAPIETYSCVVCGLTFSEKAELKQHSVIHKDMQVYTCQVCKKGFKKPQALSEHYITHSAVKPFTCKRCDKGFCRSRDLKHHKCKSWRTSMNVRTQDIIENLNAHPPARAITNELKTRNRRSSNKLSTPTLKLKFDVPQTRQKTTPVKKEQLLTVALPTNISGNNLSAQQNEMDALENHHWPHVGQKRKSISCEDCSNIFRNPRLFRDHICIPGCKDRLYRCDICSKVFTRVSSFSRHLATHSGRKPHTCQVCKKNFTRIDHLKTHYLLHENPRYSCEVCLKTFSRQQELYKHQPCDKANRMTYACHLCQKCFLNRDHLFQHLAVHTGEKPFACSMCPKVFRQERELKRHKLVSHLSQKGYRCMLCPETFTQNTQLVKHYQMHSLQSNSGELCEQQQKPSNSKSDVKGHLSCWVCKKIIKNAGALTRHLMAHKSEIACHICMEQFPSNDYLKEHLKIHVGLKPYICEVCGKGFRRPGELKLHKPCNRELYQPPVVSYTQRQTFYSKPTKILKNTKSQHACLKCKKSFSSMNHMKQHLKIHAGLKPHVCEVCGKGFSRPGQLRLHKPCKSLPYQPAFVSETLRQPVYLKRNKFSRSRKRPFSCLTCGKSFSRPGHLKEHMMIHTGERPISCNICFQGFMRPGQLEKHILSKHGFSGNNSMMMDLAHDQPQNCTDPFSLMEIKTEPVDTVSSNYADGIQDDPLNLVEIEYECHEGSFNRLGLNSYQENCDVIDVDIDDGDVGPPDLSQECEIVDDLNNDSNPPELCQEIEDSFEYAEYQNQDISDEGTSSPLVILEQEIIIKECSSLYNPDQKVQDHTNTDGSDNSVCCSSNQDLPKDQVEQLTDATGSSPLTLDPELNVTVNNNDDNIKEHTDKANLSLDPREQRESLISDSQNSSAANRHLESQVTGNISALSMNETLFPCENFSTEYTGEECQELFSSSDCDINLHLSDISEDQGKTENDNCEVGFKSQDIQASVQNEPLVSDYILNSVSEVGILKDKSVDYTVENFHSYLPSKPQNHGESSSGNLNDNEFVQIDGSNTLDSNVNKDANDFKFHSQGNLESSKTERINLDSVERDCNSSFQVMCLDNCTDDPLQKLVQGPENYYEEFTLPVSDLKQDNVILNSVDNTNFDLSNANQGQDIFKNTDYVDEKTLPELNKNIVNNSCTPIGQEVYTLELDNTGFNLQQNVIKEELIS